MKRYIIAFLIVFALLTAVAFGIYSVQKPKEIVPNQAATQSGTVSLNLLPSTSTLATGAQTVSMTVSLPGGTSVDGFQVFATISGTIPSDLAFTPSTPTGTQMVLNEFQKTATTANLKLAFITQNPQSPYTASTANLGQFTFTAPASGQMVIAFDNTLTKVVQNSSSQDVLSIPQTATYTFGASPSPTATANPAATATPTPTPTSSTSCTRGIQSVSLEPSSQSGYRGKGLTYTVTVWNNDDKNCDKANFTLSAILPFANWTANFAQTVLSIAPQTSASTTVIFTSSSNSPLGTLPVGVNTVGPKAALVAAANYVVLTPTPSPKATAETIYLKTGTSTEASVSANASPSATPEATAEATTETQSQTPGGVLSKIPTAVIYGIGGFLLIALFFILRALFSKGGKNNPPKMTPPASVPPTPPMPPTEPNPVPQPQAPMTPQTPQISHSVEAPMQNQA